MNYHTVKLGDICDICGRIGFRGYTSQDLVLSPEDGAISLSPTNIVNGVLDLTRPTYLSWAKYYESPEIIVSKGDIVLSKTATIGRVAYIDEIPHEMTLNPQLVILKNCKENAEYLSYIMQGCEFQSKLRTITSGSVIPTLSQKNLANLSVSLPDKATQKAIVRVISIIDKKIKLNKSINHNLEEQIQQLFRYWFLQFEFPDEDGLPYKANGGSLVWNEELNKEIPSIFTPVKLSSFIRKHNTGDWGDELPSDDSIKVGCIRGADIIRLNNIPQRYIKGNNRNKLLNEWDLVIEVSGGSPNQATGRSALITPGVIHRNGGTITCSNFCHAFSLKNINKAPYFSLVWKTFYENGAMFNFEGKTSGIKNFMTDSFLENMWYDIPDKLAKLFFDKVSPAINEIDRRVSENDGLQEQREYLLPLLILGKVSVSSLNYDLYASLKQNVYL